MQKFTALAEASNDLYQAAASCSGNRTTSKYPSPFRPARAKFAVLRHQLSTTLHRSEATKSRCPSLSRRSRTDSSSSLRRHNQPRFFRTPSWDLNNGSFHMTVNLFDERHRRHADTWPGDHQVDLRAINDHIETARPPQHELSISSQTLSSEDSEAHESSSVDQEAKEEQQEQVLPHQDASPPDENSNSTPVDTTSNTPNARASRLFRERRKEREKILRETIAELAERNMALEALLLRHGIVPPHAVTLRSELSIHRSQRLGGPPIHIPGVTTIRPAQSSCLTGSDHHQTVSSNVTSHFPHPREPLSTHSPLQRALVEQMQASGMAPQANLDLYHPSAGMNHVHPSHAMSAVCDGPPTQALDGLFLTHAQGISPLDQRSQHAMEQRGRHREPKPFGASFQDLRLQSLSGASDRGCLNTVYPFHQPHVTAVTDLISPPDSARSDPQCQGFEGPQSMENTRTHTRAPSDSALIARNPCLTLAEQQVCGSKSGPAWPQLTHQAMSGQVPALHDLPALHHSLQPQLSVSRPWTYQLEPQSQLHHHDAHLSLPGGTIPVGPIPARSSIQPPLPTNRAAPTSHTQSLGSSTSASVTCSHEPQDPSMLPPSQVASHTQVHAPAPNQFQAQPGVTHPAIHGIPHPERSQFPASFPLFPPLPTQHQVRLSPEPQSDLPAERPYIAHSMVEGEREADPDTHADGQVSEAPSTPRTADKSEMPIQRYVRHARASSSPVTRSVSFAKSV